MKKIFTLMFALLSVTSMFATEAEDLAGKFTGKMTLKASLLSNTADKQTVKVEANSDNTVKLTVSSFTVTLSLGVTYTFHIEETTVPETFSVTKNASGYYTLDNTKTFNITMKYTNSATYDESSAQTQNVTAKITSSKLYLDSKSSSSMTISVSDLKNLPVTQATITYTLNRESTTGLSNVAAANNATNCKCMKNGKLIIMKDGKEYNAAGQRLK